MPSIFSGLQLGMGVTIILIVAAEMIGGSSQSGMGYLLINSGQVMETEKVFAEPRWCSPCWAPSSSSCSNGSTARSRHGPLDRDDR